MAESQSRCSPEDHSMLASLWPICSILSMSRKLQTCTFTMFFTVPHASRCTSSCVHRFHIFNFVNFILLHLKFIKFKTKTQLIQFELHNYDRHLLSTSSIIIIIIIVGLICQSRYK